MATEICSIKDWLKEKDSELLKIFKRVCQMNYVNLEGYRYMTFIYPSKDVRAKIDEMMESDKSEAVKIIRSLFIPNFRVDNAESLINARRPISTAGKIIISNGAKAKGSDLIIVSEGKDVATLKLEESFQPEFGKKNTVIWRLTKGEMPTEGEIMERKKIGGSREININKMQSGPDMRSSRISIFDSTCAEHITYSQAKTDYILIKCVSLMNFVKVRAPELYTKLLYVLDWSPLISLYVLLEPNKTHDHLIPTELIDEWSGAVIYRNAVREYTGFFDQRSIDSSYTSVLSSALSNIESLITDEGNALEKFTEIKDEIRSVGNKFEEITGLSSNYKLWLDELRFCASKHIEGFLLGNANEIKNVFHVFGMMPGNNYVTERLITSKLDLNENVELSILKEFCEKGLGYIARSDEIGPKVDYIKSLKIMPKEYLVDNSFLSTINFIIKSGGPESEKIRMIVNNSRV